MAVVIKEEQRHKLEPVLLFVVELSGSSVEVVAIFLLTVTEIGTRRMRMMIYLSTL